MFNFYGITFSPEVKEADLSSNRILFHGICGNAAYGRTALTVGNCTMNGCVVNLTGNEFYTTVPQSAEKDYALISVNGVTDGDTQLIRATDTRSNLFDQLWIGENNTAAPRIITDGGAYSAWARLPLAERIAAFLSEDALSYAVTVPELSGATLFAAAYDESGRMLACAAPELSEPGSGDQRVEGEIPLTSLFPPEAAAETRTVQMFLCVNSGRAVCPKR